jgi:hypothetical protein
VHTDSNYTAAEKTKLAGIAAGAEVNIQPDWTQTSTSAKDYIKNKPVIPEGAGQATNTTLGVVKGSTAAGQAYVETDGTLSLNGYDALTTGLGNANTAIAGKVDKITGKGLSTNDYTTTEKTKLGTLVAPTPTTYNIASEADVIALNAAIRKTNHNTPITINITGSFSTATSIAFNTVGARLNMTFQNSAVLTYTGTGDTVILSEASELYVVNCRITGNTGTVGLRASRGGVINLTNSPCVIAGCAHAFDAYFGGLIIAQDRMQLTLTGNTYNYPSARIYTEESEIRTKTDAERFLDVIFAKNPDDPASKAWKEPAINPTGDYVNGVLQHPDHSGGAGA